MKTKISPALSLQCGLIYYLIAMCVVSIVTWCVQCCCPQGKSLSSRILEDQFSSPCPCPCILTPCPCPRPWVSSPWQQHWMCVLWWTVESWDVQQVRASEGQAFIWRPQSALHWTSVRHAGRTHQAEQGRVMERGRTSDLRRESRICRTSSRGRYLWGRRRLIVTAEAGMWTNEENLPEKICKNEQLVS